MAEKPRIVEVEHLAKPARPPAFDPAATSGACVMCPKTPTCQFFHFDLGPSSSSSVNQESLKAFGHGEVAPGGQEVRRLPQSLTTWDESCTGVREMQ